MSGRTPTKPLFLKLRWKGNGNLTTISADSILRLQNVDNGDYTRITLRNNDSMTVTANQGEILAVLERNGLVEDLTGDEDVGGGVHYERG